MNSLAIGQDIVNDDLIKIVDMGEQFIPSPGGDSNRHKKFKIIESDQSRQLASKNSNNTSDDDDKNKGLKVKRFKFVNNSQTTMVKPKSRMKPTFKVDQQFLSNEQSSLNSERVKRQHNLNLLGVNTASKYRPLATPSSSSAGAPSSGEKEFIFQTSIKRAPGRPRKYPAAQDVKIKKKQGRPRKLPIDSESGVGTELDLGLEDDEDDINSNDDLKKQLLLENNYTSIDSDLIRKSKILHEDQDSSESNNTSNNNNDNNNETNINIDNIGKSKHTDMEDNLVRIATSASINKFDESTATNVTTKEENIEPDLQTN